MDQSEDPKDVITKNQQNNCSREDCHTASIFEHCNVCHDDPCLFEQETVIQGRGPFFCPRRPDALFEEVDLLDLRTDPIPPFDINAFWIPTVRKNEALTHVNNLEAVAIKFPEIYNKGENSLRTFNIREFLGLEEHVKTILTFNMPDQDLEDLWHRHQAEKFAYFFSGLVVDYVLSPNFSNYFGLPAYHYLRNIWRSVEVARSFKKIGFNVILDVSSPTDETHRFYIDLIDRSKIKSISFNCQTLKGEAYKAATLHRFEVFGELPEDICFLIHGVSSPNEAGPIRKLCGKRKVIFTSSSPFFKAICRQTLTTHEQVADTEEALLNKYFSYYNELHKRIDSETQKISDTPS